MKDSFNLLKILKETTLGDLEYRNNPNKTNPDSIIKLGYKYDELLSFESSLVFYNDNTNKVIIVLDGLNGDELDYFLNYISSFFKENKLHKFYNHLINRDKKTEELFLNINSKYINYKKICLGYSLGGYFITKYMDESFSKGYIYNGICLFKNKNIINYVSNTDLLSLSTSLLNINHNFLLENNFINLLFIFNIDLWSKKNHKLDAIEENKIPDIIF